MSNVYYYFQPQYFSRCEIPECDIENPIYDPVWLNRVVPFKEKNIQPYKCLKYHYRQANGSDVSANNTCNFEAFDVNSKEKCNKWVFGETERTIVNDVSGRSWLYNFSLTSRYLHPSDNARFVHTVWYYVRGKQMETQHGGNHQQHWSVRRHSFSRIYFGQVSSIILCYLYSIPISQNTINTEYLYYYIRSNNRSS